MTLLERGTAVDGLSKIAGFYEERPSRTLQSVALSSLVKSASAEELRINNKIGAALLQKQAWTWGGVWDSIKSAPGKVIDTGLGLATGAGQFVGSYAKGLFDDNVNSAWDYAKTNARSAYNLGTNLRKGFTDTFTDSQTYKDMYHNLESGATSFNNGLASGAIGLVRGVGGAVGAAGKGVATLWNGKGFLENLSEGWDAGSDAMDNIGIGDYDIGHARRRIETEQAKNMHDYIERNHLDPNSTMATLGMNMANFAGEGLATAGAGVGAGKALSAAGKGLQAAGTAGKVGRVANVAGKVIQGTGNTISGMSNYKLGPVMGAVTAYGIGNELADRANQTAELENDIRTGFGASSVPKINNIDFGGYYSGTI